MRVRRFIGDNVADTMGKVKRELGSEAVILQTREFREGGFLGLFGKMRVEISAAIEEKPTAAPKLPDPGYGYYVEDSILPKAKPEPVFSPERNLELKDNSSLSSDLNPGSGIRMDSDSNSYESADPNLDLAGNVNVGSGSGSDMGVGVMSNPNPGLNTNLNGDPVPKAKYSPGVSVDFSSREQNRFLQEEIVAMRRMLEKMNKQMEGMGEEKGVWPHALQKWADFLADRGINENLVNLLIRYVQQTLLPEEWSDNALVYARLETNIRQICGQIGLIQPGLDKPRVVALIGATGVGKTTTIGKLAAGFSIVDKRRVALITVDTYRVAAVEQLKTFGEIIGVPVKVVMNPVGLREAVDGFADRELIFIDTAGRSPYHDLHMSELRAFLEQARPDFTMLVMSATTQFADQLKVYRHFEPLTTHLIFTKLDETGSAGSILNILGQTTLPTAYLTNGQNVPDDIEAATPNRIARYVLGAEMPHA